MWISISIILFWLLCGSWAIRMEEKCTQKIVSTPDNYICTCFGCLGLIMTFCMNWLPRLWRFIKGVRCAWQAARKA